MATGSSPMGDGSVTNYDRQGLRTARARFSETETLQVLSLVEDFTNDTTVYKNNLNSNSVKGRRGREVSTVEDDLTLDRD